MKKYFLYGTLLFVSVLLLQSCEEDVQQDTTAEWRERISRTWRCDEASSNGSDSYNVTITKDASTDNKILIDNFYNLRVSGTYALMRNDSVIIPSQKLENRFTISGNGKMASDGQSVNLTYTVDDGNGKNLVTALYHNGVISSTEEVVQQIQE